jgi:hypothetical protein
MAGVHIQLECVPGVHVCTGAAELLVGPIRQTRRKTGKSDNARGHRQLLRTNRFAISTLLVTNRPHEQN